MELEELIIQLKGQIRDQKQASEMAHRELMVLESKASLERAEKSGDALEIARARSRLRSDEYLLSLAQLEIAEAQRLEREG